MHQISCVEFKSTYLCKLFCYGSESDERIGFQCYKSSVQILVGLKFSCIPYFGFDLTLAMKEGGLDLII